MLVEGKEGRKKMRNREREEGGSLSIGVILKKIICLFLAVLGPCCSMRGLLFVAVLRLLIVVGFSCWRARALGHTGSVAMAHELSCSVACGIFPDQESNLCLLHRQADS